MNKEEKKGYGIVIPAEWKASDFNGSLDDLFAQIVDLDIKAFYRMAESTDIDLEFHQIAPANHSLEDGCF